MRSCAGWNRAKTAILLFEGPQNALFTHALSYCHLEKGGISSQMFLASSGLKQFPAELPPPFPWKESYREGAQRDPFTGNDGRVFRYVVAKTSRQDLPEFSPPNHRLAARSGGWLLFLRNSEK